MSVPPHMYRSLRSTGRGWKMNKMNKATYMNPVRFMFSDDKKVQGVLSAKLGEGWETSLPVVDTVRGLDWSRRVVV